jgi:cell division protein FtsW (lipid II flippase)
MSRLTDFAIYIVIGLSMVAAAITVAEYTDLTRSELAALSKWVRFGALTAIVFVFTAINRRPFFHKPSLWGLLLLCLAVHCVLVGALVARVDGWSAFSAVTAVTLEGMVLDVAFGTLGFPSRVGKRLTRRR